MIGAACTARRIAWRIGPVHDDRRPARDGPGLRRADPTVARAGAARLVLGAAGLGRADVHARAAGAEHRGDQMALLAGLHHERATDPRIGELLGEVEGSDLVADPESPEAANVRELRRVYDRRTRLPAVAGRGAGPRPPRWRSRSGSTPARRSDFARLPPLARDDRRPQAARRPSASATRTTRTTPCSTSTSPGPRAATSPRCSTPCGPSSSRWSRRSPGEPRRPDPVDPRAASYPVDRQRVFGEAVAAAVGFDFQRGRLDMTAHPFCTGIGPGDCRITTRYDAHDFGDAFFGVLHEVGHGLYEQGLDPEHFGTPMGEAVSLGVHETQSRLWENAVGRSRPFWAYWFPLARRIFHEALARRRPRRLPASPSTEVEPSLIRVQADEVTYNLHILIRFELEQALLGGDLAVADLPGGLEREVSRLPRRRPRRDDAEGCLQDIHWSAGLVGYFPTYTLGNLYAAQLFAAAARRPRRPRRGLRPGRLRRPPRLAPRQASTATASATARPTWSSGSPARPPTTGRSSGR